MRIDYLNYFLHVAESCSISKSARTLYISPQGLSRAIQELEKELDVLLFHRKENRISLTPAGNKAVIYAQDIVSKYFEMQVDVKQDIEVSKKTNFFLYVDPAMNNTILPDALMQYQKKYPSIKFYIVEMPTEEILNKLCIKENEMALVAAPGFLLQQSDSLKNKTIKFEKIYEAPVMACVSKDSVFAQKRMITINELSKMPLCLQSLEKVMATDLIGDFGPPIVIFNSINQVLCREMISKGNVVGFTNDFFERFSRDYSLAMIPLERTALIYFGCLTGTTIPGNNLIAEFVEILKMELSHEIIPGKVREIPLRKNHLS